ncbi:hypothetical protein RBB50_012760 [Rhinocladiella similis]
MVSLDKEATNVQSHERANLQDKRHAVQSDDGERPYKIRRLSDLQQPLRLPWRKISLLRSLPRSCTVSFRLRLPQKLNTYIVNCPPTTPASQNKREGRRTVTPSARPSARRARSPSEPSDSGAFVEKWLSSVLPSEECDIQDDMSLPPSKRSQSSDSLSRRLSQSGDGTESTVSADKKYSAYKDMNYPVVLETKGRFMRSSDAGLAEEDKIFCEKLLYTHQPRPDHSLFDDRFDKFQTLIRG